MIYIVSYSQFELINFHVKRIILTEFQFTDNISMNKTLMVSIPVMDSDVVMFIKSRI